MCMCICTYSSGPSHLPYSLSRAQTLKSPNHYTELTDTALHIQKQLRFGGSCAVFILLLITTTTIIINHYLAIRI